MNTKLLLATLICVSINCATSLSSKSTIPEKYQHTSFFDRKLLVLPLCEDAIIPTSKKDSLLIAALSARYGTHYFDSVQQTIEDAVMEIANNINIVRCAALDSSLLNKLRLPAADENAKIVTRPLSKTGTVQFKIPQTEVFKQSGHDISMVCAIQNISFTKNDYGTMQLKIPYLFYDYEADSIITSGVVKSVPELGDTSFVKRSEIGFWKKTFAKAAPAIIKASPFIYTQRYVQEDNAFVNEEQRNYIYAYRESPLLFEHPLILTDRMPFNDRPLNKLPLDYKKQVAKKIEQQIDSLCPAIKFYARNMFVKVDDVNKGTGKVLSSKLTGHLTYSCTTTPADTLSMNLFATSIEDTGMVSLVNKYLGRQHVVDSLNGKVLDSSATFYLPLYIDFTFSGKIKKPDANQWNDPFPMNDRLMKPPPIPRPQF